MVLGAQLLIAAVERSSELNCVQRAALVNCSNLSVSSPADEEFAEVALQELVATCPKESRTNIEIDELLDWVFGDDGTDSMTSGLSSDEEEAEND